MWKITFCLLTIASSISNTTALVIRLVANLEHVAKSITCLSTLLNCHPDHLLTLLKKCSGFNHCNGKLTSVKKYNGALHIRSRPEFQKVVIQENYTEFLKLISPQWTFLVCCETHLNEVRGHSSIEQVSTCMVLGTCKT